MRLTPGMSEEIVKFFNFASCFLLYFFGAIDLSRTVILKEPQLALDYAIQCRLLFFTLVFTSFNKGVHVHAFPNPGQE